MRRHPPLFHLLGGSTSFTIDAHTIARAKRLFFEQTSFVPFKAVFDGKQSLDDIVREVPWLQFFVGIIFGFYLEEKILQLLAEWSV